MGLKNALFAGKSSMIEPNAFKWLDESEISYNIWDKKYRKNDESFDEWIERVSGGNSEIAQLIREKRFLFGGRILSNRGIDKAGSLSNCYSEGFLPDSTEGILDVLKDVAMTFKAQGGEGISFSKLRPKGAPINNGLYKTDGIIPFMELFNTATETISQGGNRRGALMMSLDAWHKEIESFISIKDDINKINSANLSVEIDNKFMNSIEKGQDEEVTQHYDCGDITYTINPSKIFHAIAEHAWRTGDPGIIFTDRFRNYNLMEFVEDYKIETSNPCGEQPLPKHANCNLGSFNLYAYILNPFQEGRSRFDETKFCKDIEVVVREMDRIVDENIPKHATQKQREAAEKWRLCGIGVMGFADALIALGYTYGDKNSIEFADYIGELMLYSALDASSKLAAEKGTFPGYSDKVWDSSILQITGMGNSQWKKQGLRNASLLSIAPTGSISTMWNVSGGIEPIFAFSFNRKTISLNNGEDKVYKINAKIVEDFKKATGWNKDELPEYFISAQQIIPLQRIRVQAAFQNYIDTAISSTINLPNEISPEQIEELYYQAWRAGLKGITIFREGCEKSGILTTSTPRSTKVYQRGEILPIDNVEVDTEWSDLVSGCGTMHVSYKFNSVENEFREAFINKGSSGGCRCWMEFGSRAMSTLARAGVPPEVIIDQLKSCSNCSAYNVARAKGKNVSLGTSCPSAIGFDLERILEKRKGGNGNLAVTQSVVDLCPECGQPLIYAGGCAQCTCGFSKCG